MKDSCRISVSSPLKEFEDFSVISPLVHSHLLVQSIQKNFYPSVITISPL